MKNLALFDFDGTISTRDSFIDFLYFSEGLRFIIGALLLSPVFLLYLLRIISNWRTKEITLKFFFKNCPEKVFIHKANAYAKKHLPNIIRSNIQERLLWHKKEGHTVAVVSASLGYWLQPWCQKNDFELIATKLEIKDGLITGKLLGKNCHGEEKVRRVKEKYKLKDYGFIYAYGDTSGDWPMLNLANEKYYKGKKISPVKQ